MKVLGFLSFSAAAADWAQPAWRDVLAVSDSDDFYNPFAASCNIFVTKRFNQSEHVGTKVRPDFQNSS